jgi:sigma-B regulation protein RsbU (phosphoserine phosphatase)
MQETLIPSNEAERMELLQQLHILDTDPEEIYDGIVYLASKICQMPISTITLIDRDRQWFKSAVGVSHRENPRVHSFCARAILGNDILEVPDSLKDDRFRENPLAQSDPGVRFYAGIPLELKDGLRVGTLCVIDHKPNKLSEDQLKALRYLGWQVTKLLDLRLKNELLLQNQTALNDNLNAASAIQKSFLPPPLLQFPGFQIASFWHPAHVLGGDIFNAIQGEEKNIFYMIDVCGHDVPSALVTVSISQFFYQHMNSSKATSPKEIMLALNNEYPFERFDRFFTIFYLTVDPLTGHFQYSSGGHPPAIILKKNGELKLLDERGILIGVRKDLIVEEADGFLENRDKVFLYTDGVIDCKNRQGEQFGTHRFYDLLKSLQHEPIETFVKKVDETLRTFSHDIEDDMSLMGFEMKLNR